MADMRDRKRVLYPSEEIFCERVDDALTWTLDAIRFTFEQANCVLYGRGKGVAESVPLAVVPDWQHAMQWSVGFTNGLRDRALSWLFGK